LGENTQGTALPGSGEELLLGTGLREIRRISRRGNVGGLFVNVPTSKKLTIQERSIWGKREDLGIILPKIEISLGVSV